MRGGRFGVRLPAKPALDRGSSRRPTAPAGPRQESTHDKPGVERLLALQRSAGNAAVQAMLDVHTTAAQRRPAGPDRLSDATRAELEPSFGWDFSGVRIHTDAGAHDAAQRMGARAFTVGSDVSFGPTVGDPEAPQHRGVLIHELAHVVQQQKGEGMVARPGTRAASLPAAPRAPQALPLVTAVAVGGELGVGKSTVAQATVAGSPRMTWTLVGAPAGVTIAPSGRQARITASKAALASAGTAFTVQAALAATPADSFTSVAVMLVGVTAVTFAPTPAFPAIASIIPATGPANTADPNRDGVTGNTATVTATTAPAGRPVTVTLPTALDSSVSGTTITPGTKTGTVRVRVADTATDSAFDPNPSLPINPVPLRVNGFTAQAALGAPYGVLNTLRWAASDTKSPLNRVIGETITAGGRDDFGLTPVINGTGPNPSPNLGQAVPANTWSDQVGTGAGSPQVDVNRFVGPGAPGLPAIWILRQGFHWLGWNGTSWSSEFDNGIHRRTLLQTGAGAFAFRSEQIFPGGSAAPFQEPYVGNTLITYTAITTAPLAPPAVRLAADGVATANLNVVSSVAGRNVIWSVVSGPIAVTAGGAPGPVATPATIVAGLVPGRFQVRVTDSVFANRRGDGFVIVAPVSMTGMAAAPKTVPAGTLTTTVNVNANPGGRTLNWTVDGAAAAAGVTVAPIAPAAGAVAQSATVTRPAAFTGTVTVTTADTVLAAKTASVRVRFK